MNISKREVAKNTVNRSWSYTYDRPNKDRWKIMEKGPYLGDCEDYSLAVLYQISGSVRKLLLDLVLRRYSFYFAELNGGGHALLKDHSDNHFIDNNYRRWVTSDQVYSDPRYKMKYRYSTPIVLYKLFLGKFF